MRQIEIFLRTVPPPTEAARISISLFMSFL